MAILWLSILKVATLSWRLLLCWYRCSPTLSTERQLSSLKFPPSTWTAFDVLKLTSWVWKVSFFWNSISKSDSLKFIQKLDSSPRLTIRATNHRDSNRYIACRFNDMRFKSYKAVDFRNSDYLQIWLTFELCGLLSCLPGRESLSANRVRQYHHYVKIHTVKWFHWDSPTGLLASYLKLELRNSKFA